MRDWWAVGVLMAGCAAAQAQMAMSANTLIEAEEQHGSSGTSIEPASTVVPMLMEDRGGWRLMLHANAFAANTQQQARSERGRDAFFSTNWIMPMAQHRLGPGVLTVRTMLSFEPGTIGWRNYPELFQQGETAYGKPIVDGQHPHDFVMELAALYDVPIGKKRAAFTLRRASGRSGDWADSVSASRVGGRRPDCCAGASPGRLDAHRVQRGDGQRVTYALGQGVELSGFHGGEPDEHRWAFQPSPNGHAIDSIATRLTISPSEGLVGTVFDCAYRVAGGAISGRRSAAADGERDVSP